MAKSVCDMGANKTYSWYLTTLPLVIDVLTRRSSPELARGGQTVAQYGRGMGSYEPSNACPEPIEFVSFPLRVQRRCLLYVNPVHSLGFSKNLEPCLADPAASLLSLFRN